MKLSIITSVLNASKTIGQTVDSVIPVIGDEVEWVFVDGGSTDNTLDHIPPFIDAVVSPGTSLYGGFNVGWKHSKGDYVLYLNTGDTIISKESVDQLLTKLNGEDIISFTAETDYGWDFAPRDFNNTLYRMPFSHQGCVMRRDLIRDLGGFSESSGNTADHELVSKSFLRGSTVKSYPDIKVVHCYPWGASEDQLGMNLNRWMNTRRLVEDKDELDRNYLNLVLTDLKKSGKM